MEYAYPIDFYPAFAGAVSIMSESGHLEYNDPKLAESVERREFVRPVSIYLCWEEEAREELYKVKALVWADDDFVLELPVTLSKISRQRLFRHVYTAVYGTANKKGG